MKFTLFAAFLVLLGLSGCGTAPYLPQEYQLREGLVPALTISGAVTVNNTQDATDETIVYAYAGTKLASNYKAITQLMAEQTTNEIQRHGKTLPGGNPKKIDLKVSYLKSTYIAFYWKSELHYTAVLGDSVTFEKTIKHTSGVLLQDLNGCIAESVMDLLNDPRVIEYLAK